MQRSSLIEMHFFRPPDIMPLRDESPEDTKELEASKYDLAYIAVGGEIGCKVNGADLIMATMDIIKLTALRQQTFLRSAEVRPPKT